MPQKVERNVCLHSADDLLFMDFSPSWDLTPSSQHGLLLKTGEFPPYPSNKTSGHDRKLWLEKAVTGPLSHRCLPAGWPYPVIISEASATAREWLRVQIYVAKQRNEYGGMKKSTKFSLKSCE